MKLYLQIKTPGSKNFETLATIDIDNNLEQAADAIEGLLKQRDGWINSGYFPSDSKYRTTSDPLAPEVGITARFDRVSDREKTS